jgi:hypothetical protein
MDQSVTIDRIAESDIIYIRRHWTALAAAAWQGYICQGRGSLIVDMSGRHAPRVSYCTRMTPKSASEPSWLSATTAAQIRQYDPQSEIMCIILHDDTTLTTYRPGAAALPPPDAYAHLCLLPQPLVV